MLFFSFTRREGAKDINACKKSKNLQIWRIAAIGCCKAKKPLESWNKSPGYSSNRRISYFVVFVIVLRQCYHLCVRKNYCNLFFYPHYYSGTEPRLGVREGGFIISCMRCLRLLALLLSRQRFSFIIIIFMCV